LVVARRLLWINPNHSSSRHSTTEKGALMEPLVGIHNHLVRNWWVVLLRSLAAIAFGIIALIAPGISLAALVLVFGAYAFADGVLLIVTAIRRRGGERPAWMLVLAGIAGIAVGIIALLLPGATALALLWIVAAWALVTGVLEVAAAIRLRKAIKGEWLLALSGVLQIALGVLFILFPAAGLLTLVLWIGAFALIFGIVLFALAWRIRAWRDRGGSAPAIDLSGAETVPSTRGR
jgi:uncharacterized membrane protein HdeD (DUF308 family)